MESKAIYSDCPKWSKCSSPICPLDPHRASRNMSGEDSVCFYLLESVKRGAQARFQERGLVDLHQLMISAIPELSSRWGRIRRMLERAAFSGSKMDAFKTGGVK